MDYMHDEAGDGVVALGWLLGGDLERCECITYSDRYAYKER